MADQEPKVLDYPLSEAKARTVDGVREQEALVNQSPKESVVDTITAKEVNEKISKVKQCECSIRRVVVDNITSIDGKILEELSCGDIVVKHTVQNSTDLYHTYFVTHKQATGICLSYFAAGYSETVSYDKIEGVWTYNSTDVGE